MDETISGMILLRHFIELTPQGGIFEKQEAFLISFSSTSTDDGRNDKMTQISQRACSDSLEWIILNSWSSVFLPIR
eukprot:scaffold11571_cov122-Cylindrotheca_fusiformis.AAC.22